MTDVNSVVLVGRLVKDVEVRYSKNGNAVAAFTVATARAEKHNDQWQDVTSFFDVNMFGSVVEKIKPYLVKGKQVVINGYLKQEKWQDKQGNNRYSIKVIAENLQLMGSGNGNNANNSSDSDASDNNQNGSVETPFPEDVPF